MKLHLNLIWTGFLFIAACATPISPTGGQPDKSPIEITGIFPPSGTTGFSGTEVKITFNDFFDRSGLQQAISVVPEGLLFKIIPGRKSVRIKFLKALPPDITVQVNLSTAIKDAGRNAMTAPQTIAFSTGDRIDEGTLGGRIYSLSPARLSPQLLVGLFETADSLYRKPKYFTQPDTGGVFRFNFIRETGYRIMMFTDRNQNRRPDTTETMHPFLLPIVSVDTSRTRELNGYVPNVPDTTKPVLQGTGVLTSNRLRLRFSKKTSWRFPRVIKTERNGEPDSLVMLFEDAKSGGVVFAELFAPLNPGETIRIKNDPELFLEADSATGIAQRDTVLWGPESLPNGDGHFENEPLEILYTKLPMEINPADSLLLIANGQPVPDAIKQTRYNKITVIPPGTIWKQEVTYEVKLYVPSSRTYVSHKPNILFATEFGYLSADFEETDKPLIYEVARRDGKFRNTGIFDEEKGLQLPAGTYFVVFYKDENLNGIWDAPRAIPFLKGEPVFVAPYVSVAKSFTTELKANLDR